MQAPLIPTTPPPTPTPSQIQVTTSRYNNSRTGANLNESALNRSNVNVSTFGKLFSYPVNGQIYAQPLYLPNVTIAGAIHNTVYVSTMNDIVYAFDADHNIPPSGGQLWSVDLTREVPGSTSVPITDIVGSNPAGIQGNLGIEGTPVIDPSSLTMYLVARTKENGTYVQRLHALDVISGNEKFGGPVQIVATVNGTGEESSGGKLAFDPKMEMQRPALTLTNGSIVIAWGSHEDQDPWHGWIMYYDAHTLRQTAVFVTTPNGKQGAIWQSGRGPAVDADGYVYVASGNGDWNGVDAFGDSILKLSPTGILQDYFTPADQQTLDGEDGDFGASGPILIPGTNLIIQGDKEGIFYLLNATNMGKDQNGNVGAVQLLDACPYRIMSGPVYWDWSGTGMLYHWGEGDSLKAFRFNGQTFGTSPTMTGVEGANGEGAILTLSANGATTGTGIVWANMPLSDPGKQIVPGILRAFDASNITSELWNSQQNPARDDIGNFAKFNPPVVANGKVYVPTFSNQLVVFGLLGPSVTTNTLPAGTRNVTYTASLAATGGTPPYTWKIVSGILPNGVLLAGNGTLSGVPTANGTTFTVQVTDANSLTATQSLTIVISAASITTTGGVSVTTTTVPTGVVSESYNATLTAAGGLLPYTWTLVSGALPAGLSLSSGGVISGVPTATGGREFTVQVRDAGGLTAANALSIEISPGAPSIVTETLPNGVQNVPYIAALFAIGGTFPYQWTVLAGSMPSGLSLSTGGFVSGTPTVPGASTVSIQVNDGDNLTSTRTFSITIAPPLAPPSVRRRNR